MKLTFLNNKRYICYDNTIVCYLPCSINVDTLRSVDRKVIHKLCRNLRVKLNKDGVIQFTTTGKAVFAESNPQKYNEKHGQHIAESKAKRKAYRKGFLIMDALLEKLYGDYDQVKKYLTQFGELLEYEDSHIDALISE